MDKVLSFDIGGTAIKYGVVSLDGSILWKEEMPTESHLGAENIVKKVIDKIAVINERESIIGVAISTAGIVDCDNGRIAEANDTIKGYKGLGLREVIEKKFNLKTTVENDVNCAALGELWLGAARGLKNIVCITIGTGVGGAVVVDGKILKGKTFSSGEMGYVKLGDEKLDKCGSTSGLVRRVAERKGLNETEINGKIIFDLATKGDKISIEEIDRMIDKVTDIISTIAYLINPEAIILGGGITRQEEYLLPRVKESTKNKIIPYVYNELYIKLAELKNDAGMIGAVYNFISKM